MNIVTTADGKEIDTDSCTRVYVRYPSGLTNYVDFSTPFGIYRQTYSYDDSGLLSEINQLVLVSP